MYLSFLFLLHLLDYDYIAFLKIMNKVRPLDSKLLWVTQQASKPHCSSFSSSVNFLSCIMKINAELLCIIRELTSTSMKRRF